MESRVIKFRAWNGEQMISPDYIDRRGFAFWKENSIPQYTDKVMQFTGLKDSNGIEVFDGDIIHQKSNIDWHSDVDHKFVIEFGSQDLGNNSYQQTIGWNATPIKQYGKSSYLRKGIYDLCFIHPGITAIVIGNIYANPDLLC